MYFFPSEGFFCLTSLSDTSLSVNFSSFSFLCLRSYSEKILLSLFSTTKKSYGRKILKVFPFFKYKDLLSFSSALVVINPSGSNSFLSYSLFSFSSTKISIASSMVFSFSLACDLNFSSGAYEAIYLVFLCRSYSCFSISPFPP